ncbi:MAG: cupin domain-containing protein, partial [Mesorhizobium sp.]
MRIIACGSVPTIIAPEKYFTGKVLQTPIIEKEAPARLRATLVSFEPGARTHWHTH